MTIPWGCAAPGAPAAPRRSARGIASCTLPSLCALRSVTGETSAGKGLELYRHTVAIWLKPRVIAKRKRDASQRWRSSAAEHGSGAGL